MGAPTKTNQGLNPVLVSTSYSFGNGKHDILLLGRLSADILLVHQSKIVGFHLKLGTRQAAWTIPPVPRAAKDRLLRGA